MWTILLTRSWSLKNQGSVFCKKVPCRHFQHFACKQTKHFVFGSRSSSSKNSNGESKPLSYRAVFIGSDHFSLPSLVALTRLLSPGNVSVVVSHENNVIGKYAKQSSLELFHWKDFKAIEFDDEMIRRRGQGNGFDFGVVASFGYLIPARVIERFPIGILNVHASLLPRWRGASPIAHSIIYGDSITGVSIMKIAPHRFDVGPILLRSEIPLHRHVRSPELNTILSEVGADALSSVISDLDRYISNPVAQDDTQASFAPKLTPEMAEIDWCSMSSTTIYNLFRGLCGFTKLKTRFLNRQVDLDDFGLVVLFSKGVSYQNSTNAQKDGSPVFDSNTDFGQFYPYPPRIVVPSLPKTNTPGQILYLKELNILCVKCDDREESKGELSSWVFVRRIKLGNKWMNAKDFQNGFLSKCKPEERVFVNKSENSNISIVSKMPKINP